MVLHIILLNTNKFYFSIEKPSGHLLAWSVADPHHDDADPDPACYFDADADPDLDPSFRINAQILEKVLELVHVSYILACHLQIDADPDMVRDPG